METVVVAVVAQLALVPLWLGLRYWAGVSSAVVGCAAAVAAAGALLWNFHADATRQSRRQLSQALPRQVQDNGFVSSDSCQACHPGHYASWHDSFHRTMTQRAGPRSILGDFDNQDLSLDGVQYHLQRRGREYWVTASTPSTRSTAGPGRGPSPDDSSEHRIVMTTGSHHMQVYWLPAGAGNSLAQFPFAWLVDDQRWVPVRDTLLVPPGTHGADQWNKSCIRCHSVAGQPMFDVQTLTMDTRVAELGIACEACHGPAEEHVRINRDPLRRYQQHAADQPDPTIVHPERLSPLRSAQVCGQCHGISQLTDRQMIEGDLFHAGDDLEHQRRIVRPTQIPPAVQERLRRDSPVFLDGRFWSDGMVRVSGREYNGLIESACHVQGGMSCLSCHSMHDSQPADQLAVSMDGNQACYQCHETYRDDLAAHTHHAADSSGSQCYNCHMPHTTYGLLKAIRSHQISSPDVSATLDTGRPNACNLCHIDQTLDWTAERLTDWYGKPAVELSEQQRTISAVAIDLLRGDAGQRALAAWAAGWQPAQQASGNDWIAPLLAPLLDDPYSAVRYIARRSLRTLPRFTGFKYDYVGSLKHRAAAPRRAVDQWTRLATKPSHPRGRPVLQDPQGEIDHEQIELLLLQRDDRPVQLLE